MNINKLEDDMLGGGQVTAVVLISPASVGEASQRHLLSIMSRGGYCSSTQHGFGRYDRIQCDGFGGISSCRRQATLG